MADERWLPALLSGLVSNHARAFSLIRRKSLPGFGLFAAFLLFVGSSGRALLSLQGFGYLLGDEQLPVGMAFLLILLFLHLLVFLATWYLGSVMVSKLAKSFGTGMNLAETWRLVVVSYTPFMMVQPFTVWTVAGQWVGLAGLVFTLVLFSKGITHLDYIPRKKMVGFTLVAFFVFLGLSYLLTNILMDIFVGFFIFKG